MPKFLWVVMNVLITSFSKLKSVSSDRATITGIIGVIAETIAQHAGAPGSGAMTALAAGSALGLMSKK